GSDAMIGFAGLSHLGLVSAVAAAARGVDVLGFDTDAELAAAVENGALPIFEPGLEELYRQNRARLRVTADRSALLPCDLGVLARDVATDERGTSDLGPLRALIDAVSPHTRPRAALVVLSQVPPGFTRALRNARSPHGVDPPLDWYYQVETLIFGRAVERA